MEQDKNKYFKHSFKGIHKIELVESEVDTYDITNHEEDVYLGEPNFLTNDVLVHNSKHAGGVLLLPKPIWNYIPVEMAGGNLVTAYVENGQNTVLDALGLVKLDLLGITVLTNVKETINLIEEDLFLIEEDGIRKVVPKSYLQGKEFTIEKK